MYDFIMFIAVFYLLIVVHNQQEEIKKLRQSTNEHVWQLQRLLDETSSELHKRMNKLNNE